MSQSGTTHREIVENMPFALARRPRVNRKGEPDPNGYPVPWFTPYVGVAGAGGHWDFQHVAQGKAQEALRKNCCWTCGEPLRMPCAFVVGPMCAVNRISAEPPSHVECAIYAAKACPFLARAKMERPSRTEGDTDTLKQGGSIPGIMLTRNPGVALVWVTANPVYYQEDRLFGLGEPVRVRWYAHSRAATREEVMESINTGYPTLRALADSPEAVAELDKMVERAVELVPA